MKKLSLGLLMASLLVAGCNDGEKAEEEELTLKVETNEEYVAEVEKDENVLDASYSIMEVMSIANLVLTVDETVTVEQAKKMAKEREAEVLEEYPDYLPVVTIKQKEKELYSTLVVEERPETELAPKQEPEEAQEDGEEKK